MKVLLTAAQFSSKISGLQRHALNMVRCLLHSPDIGEVHVVLAPWQREMAQSCGLEESNRIKLHIADMKQDAFSRNAWYYRQLPQLSAQLQPDILHLSYPVPVRRSVIGCPTVVTLHDLYPYEIPSNFGFPKVFFNRAVLQQCLHNVNSIACVSDATAVRLKQYTVRSVWQKTVRIYNCVESDSVLAKYSPIPDWRGESFLLTVSQHRRNKNIPLLIRAFHRLLREERIHAHTRLLVVGIPGPETDRIHQLVSLLRLEKRVLFLQGIPEPSLQWCYRHCEALVAPSETEGFGLPVAEALLAGCRVVCSDIPAFREIDERGCRFFSLGDNAEEELCNAIAASMLQPAPSPKKLPQFSPAELGKQYLKLYRSLLSSTYQANTYAQSVRVPSPEGRLL